MLRRIELQKFKCYKRHYVDFKDLTLIVGENNAGKSTLIEALRLITIVTLRFKNLPYKSPPNWTNLYLGDKGISPSLKGIEYSSENVLHSMEEGPAKIIGVFQNKVRIEIYLDEDNKIFAQIYNEQKELVKNKATARKIEVGRMKILPQIGPLQKNERLLNRPYVKANELTSLTSLHFRNQLQYSYEYYKDYKDLVESTWPSINIHNFVKGDKIREEQPVLLIRDKSFVTEAGKMGHGLQMWLQIMWFLLRCEESDTVILDEPDVYLHADIQRKLIRFLKGRHKQIILATHSIEIISEVAPENILIINRDISKSKYALNSPIVQEVVTQMGSIHNIELIRLWSSGRFIIVEGDSDDLKYLKVFHDKLFPLSEIPFDNIPKTHSGGWSGWQRVVGSHHVISKNTKVKSYCILDSDYHIEAEIKERYDDAKEHGINLHIWQKKEIENYLIVPTTIARIINRSVEKEIDVNIVLDKLESLCREFKDRVFDNIATELHGKNRGKALASINGEVRKIMLKIWTDLDSKLSVVPGKEFLGQISRWSQKEFGKGISKIAIAREMTINEINDEVKLVIQAIENKVDF